MIAVLFLAGLWMIAPVTVGLLTGSMLWTILSFVIGGVLVFLALAVAR
jgi:hypothetical protein